MEDKSSPTVSVVLPFYNAPRLNIAIQSILNQTYEDFELILIDNKSDDGSAEVAVEFASQDKRIILLKEEKKGVVWATNKGINASRGEFVARMDADDYAFPERIALQLNEFRNDPTLGLVSGLVAYDGDEENKGFRIYVNWMNEIVDED